jgi:hypothetical protein
MSGLPWLSRSMTTIFLPAISILPPVAYSSPIIRPVWVCLA